jgi:hypothetical protein
VRSRSLTTACLCAQNALNKNVNDSINVQRSKAKAVIVTVERASVQRASMALLAIGTLLTVAGILIYYGLPAALVSSDTTLLFNIFLVLLASMMIGLVLLALNLQPLLEGLLVWLAFLLMPWESGAMSSLVWKNLQAHRLRNRKTAITYATALGFIIFLAVAVNIQLSTSSYQALLTAGTTVRIVGDPAAPKDRLGVAPADELEQWAAANAALITDWTWTSFSLSFSTPTNVSVSLANRGRSVHDPRADACTSACTG